MAQEREAARGAALARLAGPAVAATRDLRTVWRAVKHMGGHVDEADPLTNTLVAVVPRAALRVLAARADVRAIEGATLERPLVAPGLGLSTVVIGAPAFWSAGHRGGGGPADRSPVDLAIINDKIQQDHPAFGGITFQTPVGRGAASTDDHGPAVASTAVSRGAVGCAMCVADDADRKGVAPGVDSVLDAEPLRGSAYVWSLGVTQPLDTSGKGLRGADDPAEVLNDSHGSEAVVDDDIGLQNLDAYSSTFGVTIALPAGNAGPGRTVHSGCIAPNSLCMGAFSYWGTEDPSDDVVPDFSSRGPSPAGRKKPDLVGVGVTQYADRRWAEPGRGLWAWTMEGTSFASPQGAGAAALLAGSGLSDPNMQKAVLIDSARPGRSAPSQPMGTQVAWQPDWGWGALNLEAALQERTNGLGGSVPGGSARFFRASGLGAADRATLVWQRRATGCYEPGCYPTAMTLTNLDLQQLDPSTGAVLAQSNSSIDNVEQVRSPGAAATTIYKVKANSTVDGLAGEPFAVTARRPLTALATPQPDVTVEVADHAQRFGATTTVTATVRNPSPDLTSEDATATLELPAGVVLVAGAPTRTLGTLAPSSPTQTLTWTVRGAADGRHPIAVRAQGSRYGETFPATASDVYLVDGTPPAPTIAAPGGSTTQRSLRIAWGAADAASPLSHFDVEVAIDNGGWSTWLEHTARTEATYAASAGHRYRFRSRAADALGNLSDWVASGDVTVIDPPAGAAPPVVTVQPPAKGSARLVLAAVKRTSAGLSIAGRADASATGRIVVTYATKVGRKTYRSRTVTTHIGRGRFTARIRLPATVRRSRRGTLRIAYSGDSAFAAQTLRRTVTTR